MRWTVAVVAEVEPGQRIEHEIVAVDRDDRITPATLGLSIAEGKAVLAAIQARVVVDQVKRHGTVARQCLWCGHSQSSKGHYRSTFRSAFGNVPMRVRQFQACRCRPDAPKTVPALFTRRVPIAPELLYLTAKLCALCCRLAKWPRCWVRCCRSRRRPTPAPSETARTRGKTTPPHPRRTRRSAGPLR
jgi:hypothetical protein